MKKLTLAFSPCPNDTFIFDAMIHHKIDTEGLEFEVCFADVEQLNQSAFQQKFDITKHKNYKFLEDYDDRNFFDVEEYMKRQGKAKLNKESIITRL